MKIKIVKGDQVLGKVDTTKKDDTNLYPNARFRRGYEPKQSRLKVTVSSPNGTGLNTDMRELKKAIPESNHIENAKKIHDEEEKKYNIEEKQQEVAELNEDIAKKLQASMSNSFDNEEDQAKHEMTQSIMKQYNVDGTNTQPQDDEPESISWKRDEEEPSKEDSTINEY